MSKIRNCIVHASGKVTDSNDEDYIRQMAERGIGITISDRNEVYQDNVPLFLEDDMLMLKPEYCRWIIKTVHDFFEKLFDALSFPKLSIEAEIESA